MCRARGLVSCGLVALQHCPVDGTCEFLEGGGGIMVVDGMRSPSQPPGLAMDHPVPIHPVCLFTVVFIE